MKAVVINSYGGNDVVEIGDMPVPSPRAGEILVRVRAAGVNPVDWKIRKGELRILTRMKFPKILGYECAGEVADTGGRVTKFLKGAHVMASTGFRLGAFAEYVCVPDISVFQKPVNISFEEAASVSVAGITAYKALRKKGNISPGSKVLINGASGGVGTFAVQIAKIFGAEVTAVCGPANIDLVKNIGADHVIDYTLEDFTKSGAQYDIIFDAVSKRCFCECRKALAPRGVYINTLPGFSILMHQLMTSVLPGKKAVSVMMFPKEEDMKWLKSQIEQGRLKVVMDRVFPLEQAKEALALSESGHAKGKIALKIA
ncbi:MAG: NAD(P)-dependent alcohol dehydrogenase [Nitrospirae bacterium]|nr:NAD(P)-dependent alcohol dehydrogenase [Nitrospirota bacterium]